MLSNDLFITLARDHPLYIEMRVYEKTVIESERYGVCACCTE